MPDNRWSYYESVPIRITVMELRARPFALDTCHSLDVTTRGHEDMVSVVLLVVL